MMRVFEKDWVIISLKDGYKNLTEMRVTTDSDSLVTDLTYADLMAISTMFKNQAKAKLKEQYENI